MVEGSAHREIEDALSDRMIPKTHPGGAESGPDSAAQGRRSSILARFREFERFVDTSGQKLTREEMNKR